MNVSTGPAPRCEAADYVRPRNGYPGLRSRAVYRSPGFTAADGQVCRKCATDTCGSHSTMSERTYLLDTEPDAAFSTVARNATPLRPLVAHGMASNC